MFWNMSVKQVVWLYVKGTFLSSLNHLTPCSAPDKSMGDPGTDRTPGDHSQSEKWEDDEG